MPQYAPDILRKLAKSFPDEDELTKLQVWLLLSLSSLCTYSTMVTKVLSMGAKLYLSNPRQTAKLLEYVLAMGKYDRNYDIRDRTRFIQTVMTSQG